MAYLGNSPVLSQQEYRNIDNISGSFNGVTTSFPLLVNGVAPVPAPQSSNQCLISVNGVVQKPDDTGATGFRISGGNIIFSSAPTSGQSFFGVILAGADYIYAGENFPDGTVSAPSITFAQDLDTGFFRSGAGEIKYTANGTAVVTLSSNNLTAPSFIPTSSSAPTNGVYLPAANSVGISTNSSERLRINSSGNVGIGTSSVNSGALLTLSSATTDAQSISIDSTNNAGGRNGSVIFRGTYGAGGGGLFDAAIIARINNDDINGANNSQDLAFYTKSGTSAPTEKVRITSSGRLGIGTTSPDQKLHVYGNSGATTIAVGDQTITAPYMYMSADATNSVCRLTTRSNHPLVFDTNNTERARIDSSGRLLMGTSSAPTGNRSQFSRSVIQSNSSGSGHGLLSILTSISAASLSSGNEVGQIVFGSPDGDFAWIQAFSDAASGSNDYPGRLVFSTTADGASSPTERMRITNAGNVGIGTTSPAQVLDVQGGANRTPIAFKGNGTGTGYLYADNTSFGVKTSAGSLTGTDAFVGVDTANVILFVTSGAEKAKLDSSGRLLVGTSSAFRTDAFVQVKGGNGTSVASLALASTTNNPTSGTDLGSITISDTGGNRGAQIVATADGNWTSGSSNPTYLSFQTTASGASSPTERMRLDSVGNLQFNSGYGSVATAYGCRAWCRFNGTGTVAIVGSGNISSITDNGTGLYTANFSTAMPDTNYAALMHSGNEAADYSGYAMIAYRWPGDTLTASAVQIRTLEANQPSANLDSPFVQLAVFR